MPPSEPTSDEPAFDEILAASAVLDELPDLARVDAWASSVLGVWAEDPHAVEIDAHFVAWLEASVDDRAPRVLEAIGRLTDPTDGVVQPTRAWTVHDAGTTSIGIGFVSADGSEHSLLVDVADDELASLIVAPGPAELFDGSEDLIRPESLEVAAAAEAVVAAWETLVRRRRAVPDTVWVNGALARARLRFLVTSDITGFARPVEAGPVAEPTDVAERAELDAWACSVLDGAGVGAGTAGPPELGDPLIPGQAAQYPAAEQEAFAALEWADWLGAVLGLVRAPAQTVVEPGMIIDLINRCPEVTSSIPKKDRPYFEWAFSMVVPLWREAGVIDADNALTPDGADMLVGALRAAWAPPD